VSDSTRPQYPRHPQSTLSRTLCRAAGVCVSCLSACPSSVSAAPQVVYTYSQGVQWCAQVADGLAFLHAQSPRIIHRDVKLDNVLLSDGAQQDVVTGIPSAAEWHIVQQGTCNGSTCWQRSSGCTHLCSGVLCLL
jgi:serine/threonine protein kinase